MMPRPAPSSSPVRQGIVRPGLLARSARAEVARAIGEFGAIRPVLITDGEARTALACPVDGLEPAGFEELASMAAGTLSLALSRTRALALAPVSVPCASGPLAVALGAAPCWEEVRALASGQAAPRIGGIDVADSTAAAAVELAKLARLLPASLMVPAQALSGTDISRLLSTRATDVLGFRAGRADALHEASRARVPLPGAPDCEFIVFRDDMGGEWTAIRVGEPQLRAAIPVRLHSACLTGDAFGSLRCDCGDQLRMAVATLQHRGGGYLCYLDQEGCGIGLVNKMRAYRLQDSGLDTIDANTALGFERDERDYTVAARMLRLLGVSRVALLTNNPAKLDALESAGLVVSERVPLLAPVGGGNRRYLEAKRQRAGHLLGALTEHDARPAA